jgi:transglutaminase-like putative cysteine protease
MNTAAMVPSPPAPACAQPPETPALDAAERRTFNVDCELSYELPQATDFLFLIHALNGMDQQVLSESLQVRPEVPTHLFADPTVGHRFMRLQLPAGQATVHYKATVARVTAAPDTSAAEHPFAELPDALLHNLSPTRYCESDLLGPAALKLFGKLPPGYGRVAAVSDWIHDNIDYRLGSTTATSTARDVFVQRAGVCRDFAHLAVTFCRALNIPARLVVGYAIFDEPPPDFHAVFEAYLGGRWVLFDPTRLCPLESMVRIAVGRDAKDVAFATMYGPATMLSMAPRIEQVAPGG